MPSSHLYPRPTYALLATTSVPADLVVCCQRLSFLAAELPLAGFLLSTPQLTVARSGCISIPLSPLKTEQLRRYIATQTPRVSLVELSAHQLQGWWLKSIFLTSVPSLYPCLSPDASSFLKMSYQHCCPDLRDHIWEG